MGGGYISSQGSQNLATYAYSGVDQSIIGNYILKHYWNWLIDHAVPPFIAPNLLTLCGLLCVLVSYLLLWNYTPGVEGWAPHWVYFVNGCLFFAYSTFDNLDGKQARKTGSSSALGEVFDHGGDALATPLMVVTLATSLQFGPQMTLAAFLMFVTIFYLAHWESYFTGQLILRPLGNPTEANVVCVSVLFWTAFKGPLWWNETVNVIFLGEMQWKQLVMLGCTLGFIFTLFDNFSIVLKSLRGRDMRRRAAFLYLIPFTSFVALSLVWGLYTPVVLNDHPRLFLGALGLLFGHLAIRQIVHSVCKEPFKIYYNVLSPLLVVVLNTLIGVLASKPVIDYEIVLAFYFVVILLNDAYLVSVLVSEFCYYLNIRAFVITPKSALPTTVVHEIV
jgi:ethanolaminephosphotransferase